MDSLNLGYAMLSTPKGGDGYPEDLVIPLTAWCLADGSTPVSGSGNIRRLAVTGTLLGLQWQAGAGTGDRIVAPLMLPGQFRVGNDVPGNKPVIELRAAVKLTHASGTDQTALRLNATGNWLNPTFDPTSYAQIDTPGETGVQALDAVVQADPPPASAAAAVKDYRILTWRLPDQMATAILGLTTRSRVQPWAALQIGLAPSTTIAASTTMEMIGSCLTIVRTTSLYEPYWRSQVMQ